MFLCTTPTLNILIQAKYGFVAFSDPEDFLKAWKEMDGEDIDESSTSITDSLF